MEYTPKPIVYVTTRKMFGVSKELLLDNKKLKKLLLESLRKAGVKVLKEASCEYQPHGFTAMAIFGESHAVLYTYPEWNSLIFDMHSCKGSEDGKIAFNYLRENLKPKYCSSDDIEFNIQNKESKLKRLITFLKYMKNSI